MSTPEQVDKIKFMINTIINSYFTIHHSVEILKPILFDKAICSRWNNTEGSRAIEALRMTLYKSILSETRAILFDNHKKTASVDNIINSLKNPDFKMNLKNNFVRPSTPIVLGENIDDETRKSIEKSTMEKDKKLQEDQFEELLPRVISSYVKLKESDLGKRVESSRSKMISHNEIRSIEGERKLYNATDFGLKWSDAEDIVKEAESIIFDIELLINNKSWGTENILDAHHRSALSLWGKAPNK